MLDIFMGKVDEFIQKGEINMLTLTNGEKQLILYAKGHFKDVSIEIMNDLCILTANDFNMSKDLVGYHNIQSYVLNVFIKLKSNDNLLLKEKDMLTELSKGNFYHQILCYISWIQGSIFEEEYDLGSPDLFLFEIKKKG